ncbi:MAG: glycosyltransferase [Bacteroidetes bacterium]|nr:glycosyltransferase [Bacteroidota bacterium]
MNLWEILIISLLLISGISYAGLISYLTLAWFRLHKTTIPDTINTDISVVVPVRNEEEHIVSLLQNLLSQHYPENKYEIIIVNDHSIDGTVAGVEKLAADKRIVLLDLEDGKSGKKSALMLGIKHAKGQLIISTDADCHHGKYWLQTLASFYDNGRYKMVSAAVAIDNPKGFTGHFQALEFLSLVGSGAGSIGAGFPIMCNGANLAFEKEAFNEVGAYRGNEHIPGGDDIFLLEKFSRHFKAGSIGFVKDRRAIVYTGASESIMDFFRQRIRWVAKSPGYRNPAMISTAIIVLLFNLCLLISLAGSAFSNKLLFAFLAALLLKNIIDFPLLWNISSFVGQQKLMRWYFPFQLIYFFFISASGILGNLSSYTWKGRKR